jgi:MFS family permease
MSETPANRQPIATDDQRGQSLWRHTDFMKLWVGQTISLFGGSFTALAVQFIGAVTLQASPLEMGFLAALGSAPSLLVGLFAGVWIDRHRCRPILIASDIGRALLLAAIPAAALTGVLTMDLLYVVSFLVGVLSVFFDLAYQSYLPTLVDRDQLVEGNSKLVVSSSIATVAGLSVAGVVIQAITAPLAVALDAISYAASFVSVLLIRQREKAPDNVHPPMLAQVREGIGVVLGNPLLRALAGCLATSNFTSSIFFALYILFGTRELGLGAAALGLVYGIGVVGGIVGGLLAPRASARLGMGGAIVGGAFLGATEVAPAVFATPETAVPLLLLSSVIGNFGWTVYGVNATSLRQAITPRSLQGRMNATLSFLVAGMIPLGGLVGGVLGQALGLREAIALAAVGSMLSFLWVVFSPVRRLQRIPEEVSE